MNQSIAVVVPWHDQKQRDLFLHAWRLRAPGEANYVGQPLPPWLVLQQDATKAGCANTKNAGIVRAVRELQAEVVVVLDDDCYPDVSSTGTFADLEALMEAHQRALMPQDVALFETVTSPPSRGTPYFNRKAEMPVAASMGFWTSIGDYCAVRQLAHEAAPMTFHRHAVYARYFPLCGMNLAFRVAKWWPWCQFIDVPRFDDIWMGWLFQYKAYQSGHCFNLAGPTVRHARQSNVWRNLREESVYLEKNDTLWRSIATMRPGMDYDTMCSLLPVPVTNQWRID